MGAGGNANNGGDASREPWWKSLIIPVVVALVTAGVGVALNQWIDARRRASDAENTARVLEQNLRAADDALARSFTDGRYRFYDLNLDIPLDDQKLLAEKLGDGYDDVAEAISAYRLQFARAREAHVFVQDDYVQLACAREEVARGRWALRELTDAPTGDAPTGDMPDRWPLREPSATPTGEASGIRDAEKLCRTQSLELLSERFYSSFVDGNGESACDQAKASEEVREMPQSPCDRSRGLRQYSPEMHPQIDAQVGPLEEGLLAASVKLSAAGEGVGTLRWTDGDDDEVWHLEKAEELKVPRPPGADRNRTSASR